MLHKSNSGIRLRYMEIYKTDVRLVYTSDREVSTREGKKKQGMFSSKSLKQLTFYAQNTGVNFREMVTLTYPRDYPSSGKKIKMHLNTFLTWCRKRYKPFSYLWFLEFQRRGAPHFHILTDADMVADRYLVSERWYHTVDSRDIRHLSAGTRVEALRSVDGAARYATFYTSKMYQKRIPEGFADVGRFWGCSRDVKPEPSDVYDVSGMTGGDIAAAMEIVGWPYHKSLTKPLSILYNAAKYTRQLDKG